MESLIIDRLHQEDWLRAYKNHQVFWEKQTSQEIIQGFLSKDYNIYLVAEIDHEPVGQLIGFILERWDVETSMLFLYSIDVLADFRRMGIGTQLIKVFRQIGKEAGFSNAFVLTNESNFPAMQLYRAAGGKRTNPDDVMFDFE